MHFFTKSVKILLLQGLIVSISATQIFAQKPDSLTKVNAASSGKNKIKINGIVKEGATGKPLPGINITVADFSAALTDDKGNFKIDVPDYNASLTVSGSNYQRKIVSLKGKSSVEVTLFEEGYDSQYDLAVMPFSTLSKSQIPNAVSSINTQGAWNRALETPDSYLQGRVAGLDVIRRSGTPDIGANLILRGYNSLYGTSQPLIVVDGVIYDNNNYGNSIIAGHTTNHFANIDLKDIDNITVIKDASSTYGTRAANGVILITTGRAKDVATRFDFAAYGGYNSSVKELPVMKADNYRIYLADVLKTIPGFTDAQIQAMAYMNDNLNNNPDYYTYHQNTNWQKQVMGSSTSQNYYMKVSGGDNIATYALSVGYLANKGLTNNTDLTRYESRFNANLNLTKRLVSRINLAFTKSEQNLRDQGQAYNTNPLYLSLIKAPILYPFEVSSTGVQSPNTADVDVFGTSNPLAAVNKIQELNRNYRFFGSLAFDYQISTKLTFKTIVGLTYDKVRENIFYPSHGIAPITYSTFIANDQAAANVQRLFSLYTDNRLQYNHQFNPSNKITANLGFRYNNSNSESDYGYGFNTASDDFVSLSGASSSNRIVSGSIGKWNWLNSYFNVDYNIFNKYFLSFNVAADGSSRFGNQIQNALTVNGYKYAVLPSLAAAWLVSSEKFMANTKFIELLKLRASYGLVGNDDIGNYTSKSLYTSQALLSRQGLVRSSIGNPLLQWESIAKLNFGLDAGFLNERLNLTVDIYNNKISKMITYQPVVTASGFDYAVTNSGGMRNNGIEVALNGRLINKSIFKWDMGLNISANRNKVTTLPEGNSIVSTYGGATFITQIGQSANLFYGYKTSGIYTSSAEAAASGLSNKLSTGYTAPFQGGDVKFVDVNGDKIIDDKDKTVIGNPNPNFIGAYSNAFTYKRWSLDAMLSFSLGNDIYNSTRAGLESLSGVQNQSLVAVNRWRVDGQVTDVPRASYGDPAGNSRFSDRWIENGSYLRLRTISLSYNVPIKTSFFRSITVYAIANNLFTVTKYLGYDPEFSASGSTFSRGVDIGLEPMVKSTQLGIRFGL
jgi:TonB-linked SusC/RagA family outer membrane protein